jgi:hypothetical protein
VEFRLEGQEPIFYYPSMAGSFREVVDAFDGSPAPVVGLRYESHSERDRKGRLQAMVWEISLDGKTLRSFREVREARMQNTWFGRFLCTVFGLIFLYYASRSWMEWLKKRA